MKPVKIIWLKDLVGEDVIKKKYRELCKQYHPDLQQGKSPAEVNSAKIAIQAINNEWEYICEIKLWNTNKEFVDSSKYESFQPKGHNPYWQSQQPDPEESPFSYAGDDFFSQFFNRAEQQKKAQWDRMRNGGKTQKEDEDKETKRKYDEQRYESKGPQNNKKETQFDLECALIKDVINNIIASVEFRALQSKNVRTYLFSTIVSILSEREMELFQQHFDYICKELSRKVYPFSEQISNHWFRIYQNLK